MKKRSQVQHCATYKYVARQKLRYKYMHCKKKIKVGQFAYLHKTESRSKCMQVGKYNVLLLLRTEKHNNKNLSKGMI